MAMPGFAEILILLSVFGGTPGGILPMSLPPQAPDEQLLNMAPQECVFFFSQMGVASATENPQSELEKLFQEPEVKTFRTYTSQYIDKALLAWFSIRGTEAETEKTLRPLIDAAHQILRSPIIAYANLTGETIEGFTGPPPIEAALVIKMTAGETDQMLAVLGQLVQQSGGSWEEITVGPGRTVRRLSNLGPMPFDIGSWNGMFVVCAGKNASKNLAARSSDQAPAWLAKMRKEIPVDRPNSYSYIDAKMIVDFALGLAPPIASAVADKTGLKNLSAIESITGLEGRHFINRQRIRFDNEPSGIFTVLGDQPLEKQDLATIPANVNGAWVVKLSPERITEQLLKIVNEIEPDAGADVERTINEAKELVGFDIRQDLLAGLGDVFQVVALSSTPNAPFNLRATMTVRNHAGLAKAHSVLIAIIQQQIENGVDPQADFKKSRHAEFDIYQLSPKVSPLPQFAEGVSWCLTDSHLVIASSPSTVRAFIDKPTTADHLGTRPDFAALWDESPPFAIQFMDPKGSLPAAIPAISNLLRTVPDMFGIPEQLHFDASKIPGIESVMPHMLPVITAASRTKDGFAIEGSQTMPGLNLAPLTGVGVALLLPAVQQARQAARRMSSSNNMKMLMLGMHNYHEVKKAFPPAYTLNAQGKPLLSWRVHLLPYLDEQVLYKQFKLDEPWDSPHNKKLIAKMPDVFRSPVSTAKPGETVYLAPQMPGSVMQKPEGRLIAEAKQDRGARMRDITDGTSNTVVIVEVGGQSAQIWTKPADLKIDPKQPDAALSTPYNGFVLSGFADGSVREVSVKVMPKTWGSLMKMNDRTPIEDPELNR